MQPPCHSSRIGMTQKSIIGELLISKKSSWREIRAVCLAFLAARAAVRLMAKKTELFGEPKVMFQALTVWQIPANGR